MDFLVFWVCVELVFDMFDKVLVVVFSCLIVLLMLFNSFEILFWNWMIMFLIWFWCLIVLVFVFCCFWFNFECLWDFVFKVDRVWVRVLIWFEWFLNGILVVRLFLVICFVIEVNMVSGCIWWLIINIRRFNVISIIGIVSIVNWDISLVMFV